MTSKNSNHPHPVKLLTEVELEIMNVIWDSNPCTVREVHEALSQKRTVAYTSVATIMKILEQKDIVASEKQDKAHVFQPKLARTTYETMSLGHLAKEVFRGDSSMMVARLLDDSELNDEELKAIRKILDRKLRGT